jgi:hypothetical protein
MKDTASSRGGVETVAIYASPVLLFDLPSNARRSPYDHRGELHGFRFTDLHRHIGRAKSKLRGGFEEGADYGYR